MTHSVEPWISGTFSVAPEHPALAGHFPGNPLVPGVLLLQRVLNLLAEHEPCRCPVTLTNVKFLMPLRAHDHCSIEIRRRGRSDCKFECRVGRYVVARGDAAWHGDD